jgi:hypothetical protein
MKLAVQPITPSKLQEHGNLVVLRKFSVSEDQIYHRLRNALKRSPDGPWRRRRKTKNICEVFLVDDPSNPQSGQIEKNAIKRKLGDSVVLRNGERFDINTGRSLSREKYIWPVDDQRVQEAWESQLLRQRIRRGIPERPVEVLRGIAARLDPGWSSDLCSEKYDWLCGRNLDRAQGSLSKRGAEDIVKCCEAAERAILNHLPEDINELRALAAVLAPLPKNLVRKPGRRRRAANSSAL